MRRNPARRFAAVIPGADVFPSLLHNGNMNVLFIHQNFPGQFRPIAKHLAADAGNRVVAICQPQASGLAGVACLTYRPARKPTQGVHPYLASTEAYVLNGQAVARMLLKLKSQGFVPDVVLTHTGWGEALYVKDIFPQVPLAGFFEFFYRAHGADAGFDPEYPTPLDGNLRLRTRNAIHLLSLDAADAGVTPTAWQRSVFPAEYQPKLQLLHEGVDTALAVPDPAAWLTLPDGRALSCRDEVITYVSRNLEPYRGFHYFMRAVSLICRCRPRAQVLIVGGDEVSYGSRLPAGQTYRGKLLAEVAIDPARVHFLGRVPYATYLKVLQVSSAHVYLTVPFVLSWSMLEAMAAGCLVIGSDTPPVREVIRHGENGLLVDFCSPRAIADAVNWALDNPAAMQPLRQKARQTVLERYTLAQGVNAYRALIDTLTVRQS
jgi:glycosyltransferase involved in cell wall biosynthesis